jgi:hypothetical protein
LDKPVFRKASSSHFTRSSGNLTVILLLIGTECNTMPGARCLARRGALAHSGGHTTAGRRGEILRKKGRSFRSAPFAGVNSSRCRSCNRMP